MNSVEHDGENLIIRCPHCHQYVIVHTTQINCKIFRHAAFKNTLISINPHTPKDQCDLLVSSNQVYGCAKPFKLGLDGNGKFTVDVCDYI